MRNTYRTADEANHDKVQQLAELLAALNGSPPALRRDVSDHRDPEAERLLTEGAGATTGASSASGCELRTARRRLKCLIPGFDGASLSSESKDALWARFFMGAPRRQMQRDNEAASGASIKMRMPEAWNAGRA